MQEKSISNISESVAKQRKRGIIHTLTRMTQMASVVDHQSTKCHLLADSMQVLVNLLLWVAHIYHKSYDEPPSKSVLYANLCETMEADLPVYSLLVELYSENEEKCSKILTWLSQFQSEMSMMKFDSCDYSDRMCFILRIIKNNSSKLKLSYSYFLLFIFISLVRASSGDFVILFISDKNSFIDWIISRKIRKLGKKV